MTPAERERHARWQNYRITQLSFSINLFLTFSVASIAYLVNLLLNSKEEEQVLELVLLVWTSSAGAGCVATVTRLLDYRFTAQKIVRENKWNTFFSKNLGKVTWGFFWVQLILYPTGAFLFLKYYVLS